VAFLSIFIVLTGLFFQFVTQNQAPSTGRELVSRVDLAIEIEESPLGDLVHVLVWWRDESDVLESLKPVPNPACGGGEAAFSRHDAWRGPTVRGEMLEYLLVDLLHPVSRPSPSHR
jgi:hypothetical protein